MTSTPLRTDAIRVLDLDGSVTVQHELLNRNAEVVNLKTLAPRLRFLSTRAAMREFASQLNISQRDMLTFYGSGDFHHLSSVLVGQWSTPLSVVVFDNHPDWDISSPWPCCGSWVNEVLKLPHVQKVVVIGLGRYDLRGWNLLRGNVAALHSKKLELYPASWRRSKRLLARDVRWRTVTGLGLGVVMSRVLEGLPTRDVYLSVDKDCLRKESAVTNWEQGELHLSELCEAVERLKCQTNVVGADITGEYSRGANTNRFFQMVSHFNHPSQPEPSPRALEINQQTNLTLLRVFEGAALQ